jgi:hypothetical protein
MYCFNIGAFIVEFNLQGCDSIVIGMRFCSGIQVVGLELLDLGHMICGNVLSNLSYSALLVWLLSQAVKVEYHITGHKAEI